MPCDRHAPAHDGTVELDESQCMALLGTHGVGRVAVSIDAVPAVFPVNYSVLDGAVVFRTGEGTKLDATTRHAVVAFEVDDVDPTYHEGWSVMVVGMAEEVRDATTLSRVQRLPLAPWAKGAHDHVVAIRPELVSGRRVVQGVGGAQLGTVSPDRRAPGGQQRPTTRTP